jgi:hypothetical protein
LLVVRRLGDEICEQRLSFPWSVTGRATDDLDDLRHRIPITDRENMLTPDPIETFLCHAKCDYEVEVIAAIDLSQRIDDLVAKLWLVVDEVRYLI